MMADTGAIDAAVLTRLASDPELLGYMPNGVYWGLAAQESLRYVIVTLATAADSAQFGQTAIEERDYMIEAVGCSTVNPAVHQAARRIHDLLQDQPLTIDGYGWMSTYRTEPIHYTDADDANQSIQWRHRGGFYRVQATPLRADAPRTPLVLTT